MRLLLGNMSKPYENNLNEELIELIEAVADSAAFCEQALTDEDLLEAQKELSQAKKALYDYCK